MTIIPTPRVGIGVLIYKDNKVLLGKRKNAHGSQTWAPPGGHLEFGESFQDCAKREVLEETGLIVLNVQEYGLTNDIFHEANKHYVTIFMMVDAFEGEVQLREPDRCESWSWFNIEELPENLFLPMKNLIAQTSTTT